MVLKFFDTFIEKQYEAKKIDTKYPNDKGNIMVCCPFPHTKTEFNKNTWKTEQITFYEKVPSACINKDIGAFHCFVCDRHFNELGFAEAITGKSKEEIIQDYIVKEDLKGPSESWRDLQHKSLLENKDMIGALHNLKITDEVIDQLQLGMVTNCLATPVFVNNNLVNVARYNLLKLQGIPKVRYNENSSVGDIVPFDIWRISTLRLYVFPKLYVPGFTKLVGLSENDILSVEQS